MATQEAICNLALRRIGAETISSISDGSKNANHCSAFWDYILDEVLEDYPWGFAKKNRPLTYATGFGVYLSTDAKTITGITQADPAVVSIAAHPFATGQTVYIYDVVGMTEVNGRIFEVTDSAAGTIDLVGIDSQVFTAYTSGGKAIRKEADPKYSNGYTYDVPGDYLRALHLSNRESEFEILGVGENRRICTTVKDAVLAYISLPAITSLLNRFISTMAWRLAAELSVPLGKKGAKHDWAMGMYNYILGKTTTTDARSERQNPIDSDPWINAGGFTV